MKKLLILFLLMAASLNVSASLRADINHDGRVDYQDFAVFTQEWLMADYSLKFNGTDQHVTVADNVSNRFGLGDFSISLRAKFGRIPGASDTLLKKFDSFLSGAKGFVVYYNHDSTLKVKLQSSEDAIDNTVDLVSSPLVINNWYHIAVSVERTGNAVLYVNAVSDDSEDATALDAVDSEGNTLYLGSGSGMFGANEFFSGQLDDIRLYKGKALSLAEVQAIYNGGAGVKMDGTEDGLSWGSNCDDGEGNTLTDITGTVDGTLTGNVDDNMWSAGGVPFEIEEPVYDPMLSVSEQLAGFEATPMVLANAATVNGKLRFAYFSHVQAGDGDAGSKVIIAKLPPGPVRILPGLWRIEHNWPAANAKMDIGWINANGIEYLDGIDDGLDVDTAGVLGSIGSQLDGPTKLFTSNRGVDIVLTSADTVLKAGSTVKGYIVYALE